MLWFWTPGDGWQDVAVGTEVFFLMKVVSFNVNSIRSRLHQLDALIDKHAPEIIALQETKVQDQDFPQAAIEAMGYRAVWFGQKTHYGVALLSRQEPGAVQYGFVDDDAAAQRRFIAASYPLSGGQTLRVINGYFPQGESRDHPVKFPGKRRFYEDLSRHLEARQRADEWLLVVGDMNVAPADADVGIGETNTKRWLRTGKCSFLPEEREWLQRLCDWGLVDTFRHCHPDRDDLFSWFDYRSRGFEADPKRGLRIDLILASQPFCRLCHDAGIDYDIRGMERPSDHAPVWAEFGLG
jgi:exodeoxyribonuclease III